MVQKVDLDENKHALNILHRLDLMKRDLRHCDFIVGVGAEEYHTHRNILSAGSDYFDAMLTHDTRETQLGKVEMMGVDSECVKVCIDYIYTAKAEIPEGKAGDLMHVAQLMQLDELCDGIAVALGNNLSIENLFETKAIAELFNIESLLAKCCKLAEENIAEVSTHSWFLDKPKQFLLNVITSKNVSITEELKLIVFLRWVRHKPTRAEQLAGFIGLIDLKNISTSYRRHLIESEPLIMNNPNLLRIISISVMDSVEIGKRNKEDFYDHKMALILGENSGCLFCYNVEDRKVEPLRDRSFNNFLPCTAETLRSYLYILSENKSVHRLKIMDENAKWEKMKNMIEFHGRFPPAVSHGSYLYVIGGSRDCCTAASERYLPDENRWVKLTDKPLAIEKATLVALDEHIYCAGGFRNEVILDTFSRFNPACSTWVDLPPMTKAKRSCGATAFNHNIYILGGYDGSVCFTDVDCYNVLTSQWMSLPPLSIPRARFSVLHFKGVIYVFGGDFDNALQSIEEYHPADGSRNELKIDENESMHYVVRI